MGVFEEFPFMKNCGTTLERGRNWTWGRQTQFNSQSTSVFYLGNLKVIIGKHTPYHLFVDVKQNLRAKLV